MRINVQSSFTNCEFFECGLVISIISQTFDEIERRHWESMSNEWEREKQKILNALIGQGQDALDFPQDTEVKYSFVPYTPVMVILIFVKGCLYCER